jgi:hypothetical protein
LSVCLSVCLSGCLSVCEFSRTHARASARTHARTHMGHACCGLWKTHKIMPKGTLHSEAHSLFDGPHKLWRLLIAESPAAVQQRRSVNHSSGAHRTSSAPASGRARPFDRSSMPVRAKRVELCCWEQARHQKLEESSAEACARKSYREGMHLILLVIKLNLGDNVRIATVSEVERPFAVFGPSDHARTTIGPSSDQARTIRVHL